MSLTKRGEQWKQSFPETTLDRNKFSSPKNRRSDELSRTSPEVPEPRRYLPNVADHSGARFESLRPHSTSAYINTTTAHDPIIADKAPATHLEVITELSQSASKLQNLCCPPDGGGAEGGEGEVGGAAHRGGASQPAAIAHEEKAIDEQNGAAGTPAQAQQ
ncbi:hypothetical protein M758_1G125800 [Ceratodon purpureus]|nr:hypothetical protein M758_1G125800 [Ceratodon purpureus]